MKSCCRIVSWRMRRAHRRPWIFSRGSALLSRLKPHENSNLYSKMRVYDGESLKDTDPRAKSVQEYRDAAGRRRGNGRHLHPLCLQGFVEHLQFRHAGGRGRSGPSDVRARAGDLARAVPRRGREEIPQLHQGRAGAALRRVHRARDPEGLSRILFRLWAEPVRPLCRLCRCVDRGFRTTRIPTPGN